MQDNQTLERAKSVIDDFSVDTRDYRELDATDAVACGIHRVDGDLPLIYQRGNTTADLRLEIHNRGRGNRVFIGEGLSGHITLGLTGDNSTVFFGRDVFLHEQHIGSRQNNDFIAVGNHVRSTGPGRWISGLRAGPAAPALILGDCSVISRDVVLRNSDGHPVMDPSLSSQLNAVGEALLIEPHVWLGERCAILKGVTVGAFARIAFGAVVTRSVPRHHQAAGVPAVARSNGASLWTWDDSPEGLDRAREFLSRYPLPPETEN